jgi:hypothetical protein
MWLRPSQRNPPARPLTALLGRIGLPLTLAHLYNDTTLPELRVRITLGVHSHPDRPLPSLNIRQPTLRRLLVRLPISGIVGHATSSTGCPRPGPHHRPPGQNRCPAAYPSKLVRAPAGRRRAEEEVPDDGR